MAFYRRLHFLRCKRGVVSGTAQCLPVLSDRLVGCGVRFYTFQVPTLYVDMPQVAVVDPATMHLRRLISHMREAALRWRIEHQPFWVAAFVRLRELLDEIRPREAASLLAIFCHLRHVDLELVEYCEQLLTRSDDEALLDLHHGELVELIEALGTMQRPQAMTPALRLLVGRVHRVDARQLTGVLRSAFHAGCKETADLADASARSVVEKGDVPAAVIKDFVEAASRLAAPGQCRVGPRTGLELLFQHVSRRAQEDSCEFGPHLACLLRGAQVMGSPAPVLQRLLKGSQT
mmetsp:Transcript_125265/g.348531  ORF Transcript_125265/g.348531 Transcript_125265/m.348531 type:complete len:290 (+) Transcript_125265:84-953(+)